jgi:hypothetical protein
MIHGKAEGSVLQAWFAQERQRGEKQRKNKQRKGMGHSDYPKTSRDVYLSCKDIARSLSRNEWCNQGQRGGAI